MANETYQVIIAVSDLWTSSVSSQGSYRSKITSIFIPVYFYIYFAGWNFAKPRDNSSKVVISNYLHSLRKVEFLFIVYNCIEILFYSYKMFIYFCIFIDTSRTLINLYFLISFIHSVILPMTTVAFWNAFIIVFIATLCHYKNTVHAIMRLIDMNNKSWKTWKYKH